MPYKTRRALDIEPSFDEFYFIEQTKKNYKALEELQGEYSNRKIHVIKGDATEKLIEICNSRDWQKQKTRAVLFLDPFGLSVGYYLLEEVAKTQAIDVWYWVS